MDQLEIQVTTSTGEVGQFTLNYQDDRNLIDALYDIRSDILKVFGEGCILHWGTVNNPSGGFTFN